MKPEHKLMLSMVGLQKPEITDKRWRDPNKMRSQVIEEDRPNRPTIQPMPGAGVKRHPLKFKL